MNAKMNVNCFDEYVVELQSGIEWMGPWFEAVLLEKIKNMRWLLGSDIN
jgi:hypothetical protein